MSSYMRGKCSAGVPASGQSIQCAPLNRSGRAPSMPLLSEPAMGCPGTKFSGCGNIRAASSQTRFFVDTVSVTRPR